MCLSFDGGGCADGAGGKRPKTIARAGRYKGFAQARTSVARALLGGAGTGAVSGAGAGAGVSCKAIAHSQGGSESGSTKHGNKRKRRNAGAEPCDGETLAGGHACGTHHRCRGTWPSYCVREVEMVGGEVRVRAEVRALCRRVRKRAGFLSAAPAARAAACF